MIIALNNKSNLSKEEFAEYQKELSEIETDDKLILCPTFLNIGSFALDNAELGSQNVSCQDDGAYTGEVSAEQLKSYGVEYVIIGHSERRQQENETNRQIHEKLKRLLENDMTPILCIGETQEERQEGRVKEVLTKELQTALQGLSEEECQEMIIAYEPIWSIGTGLIPTKEEIEEIISWLKASLPKTPILYGGSVNEENIDTFKSIELIDGYLLGGLSLKPENLKAFLEKI